MLKRIISYLKRNSIKTKINNVGLVYWDSKINLGDQLSPIIVTNIVNSFDGVKLKKHKNLLAIGSLIGSFNCDGVVWGSGILSDDAIKVVNKRKRYIKYDIRAVRGPETRNVLLKCGYKVPEVYGDPAILLKDIYCPNIEKKKYKISLICHLSNIEKSSCFHNIDIRTSDYKNFVDEVCSSEFIISSSLHGIILAETYGVPCIFWNNKMDKQFIKFKDWYYSTNRYDFKYGNSIDECIKKGPNDLPNLLSMRKNLLETFPKDIFLK